MMLTYDEQIASLRAIPDDGLAELVSEVLADLPDWIRDNLRSESPFESPVLRANVLARAHRRRPPAPTVNPQLRLALSDEPMPPAEPRSKVPRAAVMQWPRVSVRV